MKIMIGVPDAGYSRNTVFNDYLAMLISPEGTLTTRTHGQSPAKGRNLIIQQALKEDCSHVLFIDDDTAFAPDCLMKLLNHDVDIVGGLYLMRNYPHQPIMFDRALPNGQCAHHYLNDSEHDLIEVVATGLGFCLIKTEIFRKIPGPYWITLGELEPDGWCDDLSFFKRVREYGFKIHIDLSCPVGHMCQMICWPNYIDGRWHTSYDTSGLQVVNVPSAKLISDNYIHHNVMKQQELALK